MPGYKRVPDFIRSAIRECTTDTFFIGRTRSLALDELASDTLARLGISVSDGRVETTSPILPPAEGGRWSRWNLNGRWVRRTDLPKVSKTWGWESPNFGDWSKGSHSVSFTRDVYQRELWHGRRLALWVDVEQPNDGQVTIGIRVHRVFDRRALDENDLLMACSLLREHFGAPRVVASTMSVADWLADQRVSWEILPVGKAGPRAFDEIAKRLNADRGSPRVMAMESRYDAVKAMNPPAVVVGQGEFSRYFGFKFRENLVALENLDYGNAMYLMYSDWQELSQRSRIDLLADPYANFDRIVHTSGWRERLRHLLMLHGHDPSNATA